MLDLNTGWHGLSDSSNIRQIFERLYDAYSISFPINRLDFVLSFFIVLSVELPKRKEIDCVITHLFKIYQ